jgi:putative peptidoglycan lipid II flippase
VGAVQVNAFLDVLFARYADLSGPVYLWYSIRLEQLALAVLGFACVSTVVPQLSRLIKSQNMQGAQNLFSLSFKRILFVMIPATFALLALGGYSVNMLYGHGHFSEVAISQTTLCLWAYGIGLVPATMIVLMSSLFYASGDFKTPTKVAVFTILVNLLLNSFFVFGLHMGAVSTALATSISLWVNFGILVNRAKGQGWVPEYSPASNLLLILASILATLPVVAVEYLYLKPTFLPLLLGYQVHFSRDLVEQITQLAIVSSAFLGGALLLAGLTFAYRALFKGSSAVANQP